MRSIGNHRAAAVGIAVIAILAFGAGPSYADDPVRQNGDLFVGSASVVDGYGNTAGGIWRIRAGVATLFCASPSSSFDSGFWNVPNTVIVDSNGRIVFLAEIAGQNMGLLRCDQPGAPAEKLAAFRLRGAVPSGWPDPFPNLLFGVRMGSLHVLKQRVITDDLDNPLKPQVHNADAYEFVAQQQSQPGDPTVPGPNELFRYDTETQQWLHGNDLPGLPNSGNLTSVVAHGDALFMLPGSSGSVLRRTSMPLQIGLAGTVNGTHFTLNLGLFGGTHESQNSIVDDTTVPNVSSGCNTDPPGLHDDVTDLMPLVNGGFAPLSADALTYDEHGSLGLVLLTSYGPMPGPYMTQVTSALLNDDPNDDHEGYFHQPYLSCAHVPWVQFAPILPWTSQSGVGNAANVIATAPGGMVGTQFGAGQVVRLTPGDHVTPIVSLYHPMGIAAYPAIIPSLGTVVYLTIHSPVNVLVTDAGGRRIGVDPVSRNAVNDFGPNAYDSGAGEPRVLVIKNPAPGPYGVKVIGTASGPYTIDISSADLTTGASGRIRTSGSASLGSLTEPNFALSSNISLAFTGQAPTLQSAVSRKTHGTAGVFDLPLSLVATNPTTEPRLGPAQTIVFQFDKAVIGGTAAVTEGTAAVATVTFAGNEMRVPLTGVTNAHYVTLGVSNVASADGGVNGTGSVRIGFLVGDVNGNRNVSLSDLLAVDAVLSQAVSASNFRRDVNANGTLSLSDLLVIDANLSQALPPP